MSSATFVHTLHSKKRKKLLSSSCFFFFLKLHDFFSSDNNKMFEKQNSSNTISIIVCFVCSFCLSVFQKKTKICFEFEVKRNSRFIKFKENSITYSNRKDIGRESIVVKAKKSWNVEVSRYFSFAIDHKRFNGNFKFILCRHLISWEKLHLHFSFSLKNFYKQCAPLWPRSSGPPIKNHHRGKKAVGGLGLSTVFYAKSKPKLGTAAGGYGAYNLVKRHNERKARKKARQNQQFRPPFQ